MRPQATAVEKTKGGRASAWHTSPQLPSPLADTPHICIQHKVSNNDERAGPGLPDTRDKFEGYHPGASHIEASEATHRDLNFAMSADVGGHAADIAALIVAGTW